MPDPVLYGKSTSSDPSVRVRRTTLGFVGGGELKDAAEVIADGARKIAGGYSKTGRLPGSIKVEVVSDELARVSSDAPSAYPNEVRGVRHPVYARGEDRRKWTWVTNQWRPFISKAADEQAGEAMAVYSKRLNRMLREAGFEGGGV
jgi:hypothetical protein